MDDSIRIWLEYIFDRFVCIFCLPNPLTDYWSGGDIVEGTSLWRCLGISEIDDLFYIVGLTVLDLK